MNPNAERSPRGDRLRLLFVSHRYHLQRSQGALHRALHNDFQLTVHYVEDGWPDSMADLPDGPFDACLFFVRFREIQAREAFGWGDFGGVRSMYDFDMNANYHDLAPTHHHGVALRGGWPPVIRRHGFDLALTTGGEVRDRLREDGIEAEWLPKGYDGDTIFDMGGSRSGLCTFGQTYTSRRLAIHRLRRAGVPIERFSCPFPDLNDNLNRFAAALVCNMGAQVTGGRAGAQLRRVFPGLGVTLTAGMEPMIKNMEVAGAGCAPVCDRLRDLEQLGFRDGDTMAGWSNLDELVDTARWYLDRPDELAAIGRRAAVLAASRHTWAHRAHELVDILRARTG